MKDFRVDCGLLRADRREAVLEWVASLGVDPKDVRDKLAIVSGEREYELHLSRFIRTASGAIRLDRALNEVVTEPLIIGIGERASWPSLEGGIIP